MKKIFLLITLFVAFAGNVFAQNSLSWEQDGKSCTINVQTGMFSITCRDNAGNSYTIYGPEYDFNVTASNGSIGYNSYGRVSYVGSTSIGYNSYGKVSYVGSTSIGYNSYGKVSYVGSTSIRYNSYGKASYIGSTSIGYNSYGKVSYVGSASIGYNSYGNVSYINGKVR